MDDQKPINKKIVSSKYLRLTKEFISVGIGQFLSLSGSFIGVRLLTEYLPANEYGSLSLALFTAQFSVQLFSGPLTNAFTRYYSICVEEGNEQEYYRSANSFLLISSVLNLIFGAIIITIIRLFYSHNLSSLIWLSLLATILTGACGIINGIQTAARNRNNVSIHQILLVWGKLGLAIVSLVLLNHNAQAVLFGYLFASFLIFLSEFYFLNKRPNYVLQFTTNLQSDWPKAILNFSLPFFLWGGFTWLFLTSDRWALEIFTTRAVVGLYAAVYQVGYLPMTLIAGVFSQFISPIVFQKAGNARDEDRKNEAYSITTWTTITSLGLTLLAFVIAFFVHKPLFNIIVAKEYRQASYLFPYFILAGGLFESGQFAAMKYLANNSPKILLLPKAVTSLVGMALVFFGAKQFGFEGVIGALIIYSVFYLFWILKLR